MATQVASLQRVDHECRTQQLEIDRQQSRIVKWIFERYEVAPRMNNLNGVGAVLPLEGGVSDTRLLVCISASLLSAVAMKSTATFLESNMKKARMVSVPLLSLVASLSLASRGNSQSNDDQGRNDHGHAWGHDQRTVSAPEIDPGQAMGALVLLGGGVAIIRGYRRKK